MKRLFNRLLPKSWRSTVVTIPVIRLHGTIMTGGQFRQNLSLASTAGLIEKAFSFDAPAVAVSINSPGGSPVQSRLIFKRIRDLADKNNKPVLVFVEDAAASGGYFIAVAGDEIIVDPSSIVGSIGVIAATFGFVDAIEKLGITRRVYTAGKNKSTLDPFLPEKREDVERIKTFELDVHNVFIDVVKTRRGARLKGEDDLFTGEWWTGVRGVELGLADAIGDLYETLHQRYGEAVRMKVIAPKRPLFGLPRIGLSAGLVGDAAAAIEDRAVWARFGL